MGWNFQSNGKHEEDRRHYVGFYHKAKSLDSTVIGACQFHCRIFADAHQKYIEEELLPRSSPYHVVNSVYLFIFIVNGHGQCYGLGSMRRECVGSVMHGDCCINHT